MLEKLVEKKLQKEEARTRTFAYYIRQLLDRVENMRLSDVGGFSIYRNDLKVLGKKEVPCFYHITDDDVTLILDYSFVFDKSFDSIGVDFFLLRSILDEKGISCVHEMDHPEYEITPSPRIKDLIIFQKKRTVKTRRLK